MRRCRWWEGAREMGRCSAVCGAVLEHVRRPGSAAAELGGSERVDARVERGEARRAARRLSPDPPIRRTRLRPKEESDGRSVFLQRARAHLLTQGGSARRRLTSSSSPLSARAAFLSRPRQGAPTLLSPPADDSPAPTTAASSPGRLVLSLSVSAPSLLASAHTASSGLGGGGAKDQRRRDPVERVGRDASYFSSPSHRP